MKGKKNKPALDDALLAQGVHYDKNTDEYVNPDGTRISREEWHENPPHQSEDVVQSVPQKEVTEVDLSPRNMREKMSVWFDQDILDELRRIAATTPGAKMSRLINEALRSTYLTDSLPSHVANREFKREIEGLWDKVFELERRINKSSRTGTHD